MKKTILILITSLMIFSCSKEEVNPIDKFLGTYEGSSDVETFVGGNKYYDKVANQSLTVTKDNTEKIFFNDGSIMYEVNLSSNGVFTGTYKQTANIQNTAVTFNGFVSGTFSDSKVVFTEDLTEQNKLMVISMKSTMYKKAEATIR